MSNFLPTSECATDETSELLARFIAGSAAIYRSQQVLECTLDDGVMLLVEEPAHYLWLNSTGTVHE